MSTKCATNPAAPLDLSFTGLETLQHGVCDGDGVPRSRISSEPRASSHLDLAERRRYLEARASHNGSMDDRSGPAVLQCKAGDRESAVDGAGNEHPAPPPDESKLAHEASESSIASGKWRHSFKTGDMVWGKVESHPWWPGQIFNEAFGLPSVLTTKIEGHALVAFFGDGSYGWFDPAELIPFEPHFLEKSRQTNSHNFVNAVKDAIDEVSRRGALALACHCRNLCNLRSTSLPGYVAVDVVGYETGVIYSIEQIKKERNCFRPVDLLSFLHQLAAMFREGEPMSVDWIKCKAMLVSYRKAVFEESDETYNEAFEMHPLLPSQDASGMRDRPDKSATRGGGKDPPAKKKRYLLKRREDPSTASHQKPPPPPGIDHADHRCQALPVPASTRQDSASRQGISKAGKWTADIRKSRTEPTTADTGSSDHHGDVVDESDIDPVGHSTCNGSELKLDVAAPVMNRTVGGLRRRRFLAMRSSPLNIYRMVKNVNVPKRPRDEDLTRGDIRQPKKMKENVKEELGNEASPDYHPPRDRKISNHGDTAGLEMRDEIMPASNTTHDSAASSLEQDWGSGLLQQLMSDLLVLAVDPFHGTDRNLLSTVSSVFLKLRSLIYLESLVPPPACGTNISSKTMSYSPKQVGEQMELPSIPSKPVQKHLDTAIIGQKRISCDRLEELPARRAKKFDTGSAVAESKPNQLDPVKNQELPRHNPSIPAFLMMRFPPRTKLPSMASLKAKFGRFGPLELSGTRVYWQSQTCRVLFKDKSDAQAAHSYAMNNGGLFGQIKVHYHLQEAEPREFHHGGGSLSQPRPSSSFQQQWQSSIRPNSCVNDPSAKVATFGHSAMKDIPRVEFSSCGGDSRAEQPLPAVVGFTGSASGRLSCLPSLGTTTNNPEPIDFHLPPLPPPPPPPRSLGPESCEGLKAAGVGKVDISRQLLRLLVRCSDTVAAIQFSLGYTPYHPL